MVEKNVKKLQDRSHRVRTLFNTGERVYKSKKDYNKRDNKVDLRKGIY